MKRSLKAKRKGLPQHRTCGATEGHFKRPEMGGNLYLGAERAQAGLVRGGVLQSSGLRNARGPDQRILARKQKIRQWVQAQRG